MKKYGKNSLKHALDEPDVPEGPIGDLMSEDVMNLNSSRRNFLKVFGFSFASAAVLAACKRPVRKAIPYAVQPPELTPRVPLYFASTYFDGHDYCSVLVKSFDGRPIKIEGNALSRFNGEATTARIQASVLSLYDDARLKFPMSSNAQATWESVDGEIMKQLQEINAAGGQVALLTPTIISPTTISLIKSFSQGFNNFRWVQYDPISYSAVRDANEASFGKRVFPDYNFQNTDLVVSVNCDFLGTWGAPVHFIGKYVSRRKLTEGNRSMLYHLQYESGLTLTGSNADRRVKIMPSEEKILLSDLYNKIASRTGGATISSPEFREDLSGVADRLIAAKGKSIVVSGTNDTGIQIIVNAINSLLGNYTACIDTDNYLNIGAGNDRETEALINDLNEGRIGALLMYNVNPAYDFPDPGRFTEALGKTPLSLNMSVALNETTGKAKYECPVNHYLESWDDAEIIPGELSLAQPCINPIFNTRSFQESLLKWSGNNVNWHDYLASSWEREYFPLSGAGSFSAFWNKSLSDGVFSYKPQPGKAASPANDALNIAISAKPAIAGSGYEVIFAESISMGTGMNSNNPWLIELPDPVTRHCWENVALVSPADAAALGIADGQVIKIGDEITIPALIQPGQAERTVTIHLGYGHESAGKVASGIGVNLYPFARFVNGSRSYGFIASGISVTPEISPLALVQLHHSQEGRPLVRETKLSKYLEEPGSGNEVHQEFETMHKSLYPDAPYDGFNWGIAIDLNACIGCNTCVIACQAENNSPTVGKDEVRRNRIMHWIKVHRYYSENVDEPRVLFQPVFCQHCDDAPCENVCPVSATNHSNEGLNQMAYNRCVGTKYCMNNCPYRVRRFNWFRYTNNEAFDYNTSSDLGKMVLNPDVTVRERGVVEKCTFCVQRIQAKKLEAKIEGRTLKDFEIKTACMQACPAGAIVFGNLNDENSRVSQLFRDQRRYGLLEQLHTLPSVGFLTKVWNDEGEKEKTS
ncbi:MAG TPA: 4Fe-4S dicluster domain-containing protein [Bacteroidales bacterium]|nr:4Fe-4S dicluster domain-containing protein [Bacteroidales bacterium]